MNYYRAENHDYRLGSIENLQKLLQRSGAVYICNRID